MAFLPGFSPTLVKASALLLTLFFAAALCSPGVLQAQGVNAAAAKLAGAEIVQSLKEKQREELFKFIRFLEHPCDKSQLSATELDAIIEQLVIIEKSDPYEVERVTKGVDEGSFFRNRWAARNCLFYVRFQKAANALGRLPLEERVAGIVEAFEHPPQELKGWDASSNFAQELIRIGADAVPFIVRHKSANPYHRRQIVWALGEIGDPRGVDYLIEVLNIPGHRFRLERPIAAKALGKFKEEKVVSALVAALADATHQDIDRRSPQQSTAGHQPYIGRYHSVQHAAAESLTALTGKDWGLLFNEDHGAWAAWLRAGQPERFDPATVARSDEEVAKLVGFLFHRYMSARPNPWQPQNSLASETATQSLAADLKLLGARVVPLIFKEYHARIDETPLWKKELRIWTGDLLVAINWDEAREAATNLRP